MPCAHFHEERVCTLQWYLRDAWLFSPPARAGRILQSTDLLWHGAQESNLLGGGGHTMPGPGASPIPDPPTQPQSVEAAHVPPRLWALRRPQSLLSGWNVELRVTVWTNQHPQ